MKKALKISIEVLIALLAVAAVNLLFLPKNMGFAGVNPHPYWIPVLLFALRYSVAPSVAAAVAFSLLYAGLFLLSPSGGTFEELRDLGNLLVPLSFPFAALVVSLALDRRNQVAVYLKARLDAASKKEASLAGALEMQQKLNQEFEQRLRRQGNTVLKVFEMSKALDSFEAPEIVNGLLAALNTQLNIQQSSFYRLEGADMALLGRFDGSGEKAVLPERTSLPPMVRRALEERVPVWQNGSLPKGDSGAFTSLLLTGPVLLPDGTPYGAVCVHAVPFIAFNREMISLFALLLEWAGRNLRRAIELATQREKEIFDVNLQVYKYGYLHRLVAREMDNYRRHANPFTVLIIAWKCGHGSDPTAVRTVVHALMSQNLRASDILSAYSHDHAFVILLTHTDREGAEKYTGRMVKQIAAFCECGDNRNIEITTSLASVEAEDKAPEDILKRAEHGIVR
ncbi:MAG: hypothetical protein V1913_11205 [Fibrobacterota bacterium]